MSNDREDFTVSQQRAFKSRTIPKVDGAVTKDFTWRTLPAIGRKGWYWLPTRFEIHGFGWNPTGGPATTIIQVQTYWLCMGWSTITEETPNNENPK